MNGADAVLRLCALLAQPEAAVGPTVRALGLAEALPGRRWTGDGIELAARGATVDHVRLRPPAPLPLVALVRALGLPQPVVPLADGGELRAFDYTAGAVPVTVLAELDARGDAAAIVVRRDG